MQVSLSHTSVARELRIAEVDFRLSTAARANVPEQDTISDRVVAALCPILDDEKEEQGSVPFPAAWISSVTRVRWVLRV